MEKLAQLDVEILTPEAQQQIDGGCWVCTIWGPPFLGDPVCPSGDAPLGAV